MTLAVATASGELSARIVLCKQLEPAAGSLVFFTNYHSRKGRALEENPRAAAVFHWDTLDRQIRLEGGIARVSAAESDAYFATRPWESRIGAWASQQSQPIPSRDAFVEQIRGVMARFGIDPQNPPAAGDDIHIPRPPHWGGYRLTAQHVELWCSAPGRLHDRAVWKRSPDGGWTATRLQP